VSEHPIPLGGWKEMQEVYGVLNEGLKRDILKDAVAEYEEVYTLEQLFADRNKVGEIADVNCEECRAKRDHIHATQIRGMGPRILVIVLKRFSYDGSKIKSRVEYPIAFDLANMSPGATGTYLLSGVVFHHGTGRNRGHYTSEFYNSYKTVGPDGEKSDRWFSADDQIVTELPNGPKLVSGEAYVLVYTRM
jgi:ubiquitin C-terminal hydrolase